MQSRVLSVVLLVVVALSTAACSSAASGGAPRHIAITMTDAMRYEPGDIAVKLGETVTFDVKNAGQIAHEFFVGSETAQTEHEAEMKQMAAMGHDHPTGVHVMAGETKPLTVTFSTPGAFIIGCHEPGHYAAGMVGKVIVGAA